jgi:predicted metal-dependent enzyme (double-stranded beta helix superfamily)
MSVEKSISDDNFEFACDDLQVHPPGVHLIRRRILMLSIGTLASTFVCGEAAARQKPEHPLNQRQWDQFIKRFGRAARIIVTTKFPDEEVYLQRIASLIEPISVIPRSKIKASNGVGMEWLHEQFPISLAQFDLKPGAVIPPHDHRNFIGVLRVMRGSVRIRSFELVEHGAHQSRDARFYVRATGDELLRPGGMSTLSRCRANIHEVRAGVEGAQIVDAYTYFSEGSASRFMTIEERPVDEGEKIYAAQW